MFNPHMEFSLTAEVYCNGKTKRHHWGERAMSNRRPMVWRPILKVVMTKAKQFNVADYFSLYRFIAIPAIIVAIVLHLKILTSVLLFISFTTDAIDGYLARRKHIETSRGAKLDSWGDLLTLVGGLAAFLVFETEFFIDHLTIIIVAVSLFIIQMLLALFRFKQLTSYHTYMAKVTTVLFGIFLVIIPAMGPIKGLFYVTFGMGIVEALEEILITLFLKSPKENVKGLYWVLKRRPTA